MHIGDSKRSKAYLGHRQLSTEDQGPMGQKHSMINHTKWLKLRDLNICPFGSLYQFITCFFKQTGTIEEALRDNKINQRDKCYGHVTLASAFP